MSKILTNTRSPSKKKNGLNIAPINPEIFEFLPYVKFFNDFQYKIVISKQRQLTR